MRADIGTPREKGGEPFNTCAGICEGMARGEARSGEAGQTGTKAIQTWINAVGPASGPPSRGVAHRKQKLRQAPQRGRPGARHVASRPAWWLMRFALPR
jgi:hypothetical protein